MNKPKLTINGQIHMIAEEDLFQPLSQTLRRSLELTGTKVVCAEGDCGACTVIVKEQGRSYTLNSCIAPTFNMLDAEILTVEGLEQEGQLHSVQKSMCETQGTQCGYCTPGIVCSLAWSADQLAQKNKVFTKKKVQNALTGNLCRCTGYESIVDAGLALNHVDKVAKKLPWRTSSSTASAHQMKSENVSSRVFTGEEREHFMPVTFHEAAQIKGKYPEVRLISGATDLGVLTNKGKLSLTRTMSLRNIKEARKIESLYETNELKIGASVSLAEIESYLEQNHLHSEFVELLHVFASPQIKNAGTLLGNLMNGSPIGDTLPFLFAVNARVELISTRGTRTLNIHQLFKGYKSFHVEPDELATSILVSKAAPENLKLYKVSLREDLDISAVTLAASCRLDQQGVSDVKLIFGGLSAFVQHAPALEKLLSQASLSTVSRIDMNSAFDADFKPFSDVRGSADYRKMVSLNLVKKYFREIQQLRQHSEVVK